MGMSENAAGGVPKEGGSNGGQHTARQYLARGEGEAPAVRLKRRVMQLIKPKRKGR
jgi:hypothetical protein